MTTRGDLAGLLRAWRDRLSPGAVGLEKGPRRTRGLRREEVAMLAGLSVDYLVRLEQGRADRPSEQVVAALARALQLSPFERDQLYVAAGIPAPLPTAAPTHIPGSVQRLLARMPDVAIGVWTVHWNLLTANPAWVALLGPAGRDFNLIVRQFAGTAPSVVMDADGVDRFERALVSDLRTAVLRYPQDPSVLGVLHQLESNHRFARMWADGTMVEHQAAAKTFIHPVVGRVTLDCDVLSVAGSDLRIVTYTAAPDTDDASRFGLIRTIGGHSPATGAPSTP